MKLLPVLFLRQSSYIELIIVLKQPTMSYCAFGKKFPGAYLINNSDHVMLYPTEIENLF